MDPRFEKIINETFRVDANEGPDKVGDLKSIVARCVEPGMTIHALTTHLLPFASANEIIRQFYNKDPKFTFVTLGSLGHAFCMIHFNMLKKLITTFAGDVYPTPGPSKLFQRAYLEKSVEFENWSILALSEMLLAGAMGVPFLPIRSIGGSSMAEENHDSYAEIEDPFGQSEEKVGLVKALVPDIVLVHGWAADRAGNTILAPPYSEGIWGAFAARKGTIVTVEKIVDSDFIRRYSHLVRLPGMYVRGVAEAPFGGHPGGMVNLGVPEFDSYAEDYDFIINFREATQKRETFSKWIEEWILGPGSHEGYLKKLGSDHLLKLRGLGHPDAWRSELETFSEKLPLTKECTENEQLTVASTRIIMEKVKKHGFKSVLAGIGASTLSSWMAYYHLKRQGVPVDLIAEIGLLGYAPRPGSPFLFNYGTFPTVKMAMDSFTSLGLLVANPNSRCLGVLGAGQVDRLGNINSTKIPDVYYLVGSGGANDVMSTAEEVILICNQGLNRLVKKVPYITGPGVRVKTLITNMGVYRRESVKEELKLAGYFQGKEGEKGEELVRKIKETCGWNLQVASNLEAIKPPTLDEVLTLRLLDPRRSFIG